MVIYTKLHSSGEDVTGFSHHFNMQKSFKPDSKGLVGGANMRL
jgi:hypothetical protein